MNKKRKLETKLSEEGAEQKSDNGFKFVEVSNPQSLLEWATVNGYAMHGSTRQIRGELVPQQAHDLVKESGNREAVYMTRNPLLAEFTALTGGKNIDGRQNRCFLKIKDGKVAYPQKPEFHVGKPEEVEDEGYVYLFDKETQVDEEVGGEFLSYKPVKPLVVVKVRREDFKYPIEKIEDGN